jgi:hypothetical protein
MDVAQDQAKRAYWSKHVAAWRASGLSVSAFCRREGLKPSSFDYWRVQKGLVSELSTQQVGAKRKAITLVAAQRLDAAPAEAAPIKLSNGLGWELSLPSSIEPKWLVALLRALR